MIKVGWGPRTRSRRSGAGGQAARTGERRVRTSPPVTGCADKERLITENLVPNSGWRVKERLKSDGTVRIAVVVVLFKSACEPAHGTK